MQSAICGKYIYDPGPPSRRPPRRMVRSLLKAQPPLQGGGPPNCRYRGDLDETSTIKARSVHKTIKKQASKHIKHIGKANDIIPTRCPPPQRERGGRGGRGGTPDHAPQITKYIKKAIIMTIIRGYLPGAHHHRGGEGGTPDHDPKSQKPGVISGKTQKQACAPPPTHT